jgi:hypothetical protein
MIDAILVILRAVDAARSSARAFHLALPTSIACLIHFLGTNTGRPRKNSLPVRPLELRDGYFGVKAAAALHWWQAPLEVA